MFTIQLTGQDAEQYLEYLHHRRELNTVADEIESYQKKLAEVVETLDISETSFKLCNAELANLHEILSRSLEVNESGDIYFMTYKLSQGELKVLRKLAKPMLSLTQTTDSTEETQDDEPKLPGVLYGEMPEPQSDTDTSILPE